MGEYSSLPRYPGAYDDYGVRAGAKAQQQHLSEEGLPIHEEKIFLEDGSMAIIIAGQTTLRQLEKTTGIPAKEIIDKLGLPAKVSLDESFGRLRKRYPFTLQDVRDTVTEILNRRTAQTEKKEEEYKEPQEPQVLKEEEQEHESKLTRGVRAEDQSGILITGRMTLYDIEKETGISARKIADKLGLPERVSLDETLGRLRKRYLFAMQDVRDAVADLMKEK